MSAQLNFTRRTFLLAAGAAPLLRGQSLLRREWTAKWIAVPKAPKTEYGVYHFRKTFDLAARPERFLVHASGDNRYQLFVNGQRAAWGPARGDLFHWRYETVDIAGFLQPGKNLLAAVVWNFGEHAPEAQITLETGFVLQGDGDAERVADTGPSWKCVRNEAYAPVVITSGAVRGYWAAGPGDRVERRRESLGLGVARIRRFRLDLRRRDRTRRRPRGPRRAHPLDAGAPNHPHDGGAHRKVAHRAQGQPRQQPPTPRPPCSSIRAI